MSFPKRFVFISAVLDAFIYAIRNDELRVSMYALALMFCSWESLQERVEAEKVVRFTHWALILEKITAKIRSSPKNNRYSYFGGILGLFFFWVFISYYFE